MLRRLAKPDVSNNAGASLVPDLEPLALSEVEVVGTLSARVLVRIEGDGDAEAAPQAAIERASDLAGNALARVLENGGEKQATPRSTAATPTIDDSDADVRGAAVGVLARLAETHAGACALLCRVRDEVDVSLSERQRRACEQCRGVEGAAVDQRPAR